MRQYLRVSVVQAMAYPLPFHTLGVEALLQSSVAEVLLPQTPAMYRTISWDWLAFQLWYFRLDFSRSPFQELCSSPLPAFTG